MPPQLASRMIGDDRTRSCVRVFGSWEVSPEVKAVALVIDALRRISGRMCPQRTEEATAFTASADSRPTVPCRCPAPERKRWDPGMASTYYGVLQPGSNNESTK